MSSILLTKVMKQGNNILFAFHCGGGGSHQKGRQHFKFKESCGMALWPAC